MGTVVEIREGVMFWAFRPEARHLCLELHSLLLNVDPGLAERLHPRLVETSMDLLDFSDLCSADIKTLVGVLLEFHECSSFHTFDGNPFTWFRWQDTVENVITALLNDPRLTECDRSEAAARWTPWSEPRTEEIVSAFRAYVDRALGNARAVMLRAEVNPWGRPGAYVEAEVGAQAVVDERLVTEEAEAVRLRRLVLLAFVLVGLGLVLLRMFAAPGH